MQLGQPLGLLLEYGVPRRRHRRAVERGRDPQAAALDLGVLEATPTELVLDHAQHEAALATELVGGVRGLGLGQRRAELLDLARRDRAGLGHPVEDVLVAREQGRPRRLVAVGAQVVRGVQHRGEHGRLPGVELLGRDAEEGVGGRLDAVRPAAEVDGVEVALEDLLLGLLLLHLQGEEGLLDLALEGALLREVEDLDVLLGDRGRTLGGVALRVREGRPEDALRVDALVGPEGAVLGGDRGVLHDLRDVRERDRLTVLVRELAQLGLAVGVVDVGRLGLVRRVRVGDLGALVGEEEDPADHQAGHDQADQSLAEQFAPPGTGTAGLAVGPSVSRAAGGRLSLTATHPMQGSWSGQSAIPGRVDSPLDISIR